MENCNFPRFCPCVCMYLFVERKNGKASQSIQRNGMWLQKLYTGSNYLHGEVMFITSIIGWTVISEFKFQAKNDLARKWVKREKIPFRELIHIFNSLKVYILREALLTLGLQMTSYHSMVKTWSLRIVTKFILILGPTKEGAPVARLTSQI